jgi:hypothetical protein
MFVLVVLGVAVGLLALAVRYRTEERRTTDYLALVTEIAQNQEGLAVSVTQLMSNLGGMDREDLLNQIDSLGAQVSTDVQALAAQDVPPAVSEANGFLTVALRSWQGAITSMDDAMLLVLDSDAETRSGEVALTRVFEQLRVGDLAYAGFLEARERIEADEASGSIAAVKYVSVGEDTLFNGAVIAGRLRNTRNLDGRHDISVTARTVPAPLGEQNGRPVVPDAESYTVLAVVTNEGNLPEEAISVTMELGLSAGDASPIMREQLILLLEPGQATTIEFADLDLEPGELYNLQIAASITQDADPLNNRFELIFFRNQDA